MWRGSTEGPTPVFFLFFSLLFLSLVNAFLFHGPSDGIPSSVSCCLCGLLGNHGSCLVGRDFFLFTGVTEEVGRLRGQHMGGTLYSFYVGILMYGLN